MRFDVNRAWILCKKTFSLSLVFNALLTIACAVGILGGFYWFYQNWQPFYPYLVNGNLFWVAIVAAAINVFPSAHLGRHLKTGRFLFHHYFYGFLVLCFAFLYVLAAAPASLLTIFLVDNSGITVNVGRFFILGGFTLLLDDLPDVSTRLEETLNKLKTGVLKAERVISAVQLLSGAACFYVFVAICLAIINVPGWFTLANVILMGTLLVTAVTAFWSVKRKIWRHARDSHPTH